MKRSNKRAQMSVRDNVAEILLYDAIDPFWGIGAKQFAEDIKDLGDVDEITVRINSPGGDVFDGLAIFNTLQSHRANVTTSVDGLAASIASIIALAGDAVWMAENAMFMIHNPFTVAIGDAAELRKTADTLEKVKDTLVSTYAGKTGLESVEISDFMNDETWFDAHEAVEQGFADEVTGQVAVAASFDLSRFHNAPTNWNMRAKEPDTVPWNRYALERKLEIAKRL